MPNPKSNDFLYDVIIITKVLNGLNDVDNNLFLATHKRVLFDNLMYWFD